MTTTVTNGRRPLNAKIRGIPLPERMRHLHVSDEGYPIPWFVAWLTDDKKHYAPKGEGTPDFRVMGNVKEAHTKKLCWICGQPRGKFDAFVIGPMCAVNRISAEPPSHFECAEYAVKTCPFLTQPNMRRNTKGLPETVQETEGMIKRNPGVTLVWVTKRYIPVQMNPGTLFRLGEPTQVSWWREGRSATRTEILESIDSGMPVLRAQAIKDGLLNQLPGLIERAMKLVPRETHG